MRSILWCIRACRPWGRNTAPVPAFEVRQRHRAAAVSRQDEGGCLCTDCGNHVPSFRRFHGVNVTRDEAPVKGWRHRGNLCESVTFGPAVAASDFEVRGLERKGMSGCA